MTPITNLTARWANVYWKKEVQKHHFERQHNIAKQTNYDSKNVKSEVIM